MGRAIYPHELTDADFSWLISTYRENNPSAVMIESPCLPVALFLGVVTTHAFEKESDNLPMIPDGEGGLEDDAETEKQS